MTERPSGPDDSGQQTGVPSQRPDPGLRSGDYAGISPLTLPVEALLRAIKALSKLFWISMVLDEGTPVPSTLEGFFNKNNLQARMVAAGFAFTEGVGADFMGALQDEAQRKRRGAWRGAFEPPSLWTARRDRP